ncbi:MAG: hypothetical protein V1647_05485 [Pseudomonadota bacterium]
MRENNKRKNRLWIMNIDHALDRHTAEKGFSNILTKYMMLVDPMDKFIVPPNIDQSSLSYVTKTKNLDPSEEWVMRLTKTSDPFDTVDSIINNTDVMSNLKELAATNRYFIEPYIPSLKLLALSNMVGIPLSDSGRSALKNGDCIKLNDKYVFKKLSEELGVKVVDYNLAFNKDELIYFISTMGERFDRLIIKKTFSTGGYGNLNGTSDELLKMINGWYNPQELVIIEPFINIDETLGSLIYVGKDQYQLIGIDKQNIKDGGWKGCDYPYYCKQASPLIEKLSARYAEYMLENKLEGYLNLDWAVVRENNDGIELYALESNYRYNGFSFVLDVAKGLFGLDHDRAFISYDSWYELSPKIKDDLTLLDMIDKINHLFKNSNKGGAVCTNMPKRNKVELMLVADNYNAMSELKNLTRSFIGLQPKECL